MNAVRRLVVLVVREPDLQSVSLGELSSALSVEDVVFFEAVCSSGEPGLALGLQDAFAMFPSSFPAPLAAGFRVRVPWPRIPDGRSATTSAPCRRRRNRSRAVRSCNRAVCLAGYPSPSRFRCPPRCAGVYPRSHSASRQVGCCRQSRGSLRGIPRSYPRGSPARFRRSTPRHTRWRPASVSRAKPQLSCRVSPFSSPSTCGGAKRCPPLSPLQRHVPFRFRISGCYEA